MKVEVNGKTYCVETLITDNERLRKEIIESAKTNRLVLDSVRAEIEQRKKNSGGEPNRDLAFNVCLQIIDKYKTERSENRC